MLSSVGLRAGRHGHVRSWLQGACALSRSFKVYTRTGDTGQSSLFNGERRCKDDRVFDALGNTDELNAAVGVARAAAGSAAVHSLELMLPQLDAVQSRLLDVGSAVATPLSGSNEKQVQRTQFDGAAQAELLEQWIDEMDLELPTLKNFILPGGGGTAASLHVARAICRRTERSVVSLTRDGNCDPSVAIYLNRLSDYLFVAARYASQACGHTEAAYKKTTASRSQAG